jgi:hypothetical protein
LGEQRHLNQILARVPFELTKLFGEGPIKRDFVFTGHIKIDIVRNTGVLPHLMELVGLGFFGHIFPLCRRNTANWKLDATMAVWDFKRYLAAPRTAPMEARARIRHTAKVALIQLI